MGEHLPLFHFKPDLNWLLLGGKGCTMRCPFCNTWRHSQTGSVRTVRLEPGEIVQSAIAKRCKGISFGVNEPAPMQEFVQDVFVAGREAGLETHLATGGMWSSACLRELLPYTSAVTLGLKGLDESFLSKTLGCERGAVLEVLALLVALRIHFEVSWLVMPGITDSAAEAGRLREQLANLDTTPPIILLPYLPDYTWKDQARPATLADLQAFRRELSGYPGTVYELHPDSSEMNTRCGKCSRPLVRRGMAGLIITSHPHGKPKDKCPGCGTSVPYVVSTS